MPCHPERRRAAPQPKDPARRRQGRPAAVARDPSPPLRGASLSPLRALGSSTAHWTVECLRSLRKTRGFALPYVNDGLAAKRHSDSRNLLQIPTVPACGFAGSNWPAAFRARPLRPLGSGEGRSEVQTASANARIERCLSPCSAHPDNSARSIVLPCKGFTCVRRSACCVVERGGT